MICPFTGTGNGSLKIRQQKKKIRNGNILFETGTLTADSMGNIFFATHKFNRKALITSQWLYPEAIFP